MTAKCLNELEGSSTDADSKADATVPLEVQNQIGKQLREVYGKFLSEPLPDKFTVLLTKLAGDQKK